MSEPSAVLRIGAEETEYERVEISVGIGRALRKLGPRDGKVSPP